MAKSTHLVVVEDLTAALLGPERDVIVEVEVVAVGRNPLEVPSHALFEGCELGQRGARDREESRVAMGEMGHDAVESVGQVRATGATLFPSRTKHEVVDDELAASGEKIGERFFTLRSIENVILVDFFPRQGATLAAEFVAQAREFFLFA